MFVFVCYALLYVHSSFAIILKRERERERERELGDLRSCNPNIYVS